MALQLSRIREQIRCVVWAMFEAWSLDVSQAWSVWSRCFVFVNELGAAEASLCNCYVNPIDRRLLAFV